MNKNVTINLAYNIFCLFFFNSCVTSSALAENLSSCTEKTIGITVIIPSFNNENYCERNLDSVVGQNYKNLHVVIIDDCSTDLTGKKIDEYVEKNNLKDIVTIIHNKQRQGSIKNIYDAVHTIDDSRIVVLVDGDDELGFQENRQYDKNVLTYIADVYNDKKIWMTYGQYIHSHDSRIGHCAPIAHDICRENKFRQSEFVSSHLKTFYAGLFKKIKKEDLMHEDKFFPAGGDLAIMFALLEMCAEGHFKFIDKILYFYNSDNPLNDIKVCRDVQLKSDQIIRSRRPYDPLLSLNFLTNQMW